MSEHLSSYQIVTRVWTPLELLSSMSLPNSQLILLQQSLTTPNNSWGASSLLIAESRCSAVIACNTAVALLSWLALHQMTGMSACHAVMSGMTRKRKTELTEMGTGLHEHLFLPSLCRLHLIAIHDTIVTILHWLPTIQECLNSPLRMHAHLICQHQL